MLGHLLNVLFGSYNRSNSCQYIKRKAKKNAKAELEGYKDKSFLNKDRSRRGYFYRSQKKLIKEYISSQKDKYGKRID